MNPATYEELIGLLAELNTERNDIQKEIDDNTLQIIEARSYTKEILDREEEDFKVFSPRKIEDIYKEELEKSNVKQANFENRNLVLVQKKEKLDSIISVLEKVSAEVGGVFHPDTTVNENSFNNVEEENLEDSISEENVFFEKEDSQQVDDTTYETINNSVKNLKYLMNKIELSIKLIRQDPMRTKVELETVNKGIKKVVDKLNHGIED